MNDEAISVLKEIRDLQKETIENQRQALESNKKAFELAKSQQEFTKMQQKLIFKRGVLLIVIFLALSLLLNLF